MRMVREMYHMAPGAERVYQMMRLFGRDWLRVEEAIMQEDTPGPMESFEQFLLAASTVSGRVLALLVLGAVVISVAMAVSGWVSCCA